MEGESEERVGGRERVGRGRGGGREGEIRRKRGRAERRGRANGG